MRNIEDSLDLLLSAKKSFIINLFTMFMVLSAVGIQFLYMSDREDKIIERISERDILIITNSGLLTGKTTPDFKVIAKQFAIITFNSTLNYDPKDILPQLNFMQIYSSSDIFENYKNMIQTTESNVKLEHKIYHASIDSKENIIIKTLIPNMKYEIKIVGTRQKISNYSSSNKRIMFTTIIEKKNDTGIKNIFGIKITRFNLDEI